MDTKPPPHAGFDIAKQLSMALVFIGAILLLNCVTVLEFFSGRENGFVTSRRASDGLKHL